MRLTEAEAKTKRCQESFGPYHVTPDGRGYHYATAISVSGGSYGVVVNGPSTMASPACCIGSACMAWCFIGETNQFAAPLGYCGKAGGA